jgi:hypothetical protein
MSTNQPTELFNQLLLQLSLEKLLIILIIMPIMLLIKEYKQIMLMMPNKVVKPDMNKEPTMSHQFVKL